MKSVTILLVEDVSGDRLLVKEALKACGIPVAITEVEDGEKALSFLTKEESKPDLIILDLNLPKVSGIALLEQYHPKDRPPIVVFSSTWSQIDSKRALALGAREVVHKSMDMKVFRAAVCGMVRRWALE